MLQMQLTFGMLRSQTHKTFVGIRRRRLHPRRPGVTPLMQMCPGRIVTSHSVTVRVWNTSHSVTVRVWNTSHSVTVRVWNTSQCFTLCVHLNVLRYVYISMCYAMCTSKCVTLCVHLNVLRYVYI